MKSMTKCDNVLLWTILMLRWIRTYEVEANTRNNMIVCSGTISAFIMTILNSLFQWEDFLHIYIRCFQFFPFHSMQFFFSIRLYHEFLLKRHPYPWLCIVYFDRAISNLCFTLNEYTRHMMVTRSYYINNVVRNPSYKWYYNVWSYTLWWDISLSVRLKHIVTT